MIGFKIIAPHTMVIAHRNSVDAVLRLDPPERFAMGVKQQAGSILCAGDDMVSGREECVYGGANVELPGDRYVGRGCACALFSGGLPLLGSRSKFIDFSREGRPRNPVRLECGLPLLQGANLAENGRHCGHVGLHEPFSVTEVER